MIIKSKDKHGNQIEFNPKGRGARYTVNGLKKKGVTTIIGERFGKGALMWWAENCVFEALHQKLKHDKKAVDEVQQFIDDLRYRVKGIKENASNIGTNMHSLCEDYITGKNPVEPTTEPLKTMFNNIVTGLLLLLTINNSLACDVCGSSSIGGSSAYNLSNQKMIGLTYSYGKGSYTDRSYEELSYITHKKTINVNVLWNVSKSLQVEAILPYSTNERQYLSSNEHFSSLGDVQGGFSHYYRFGKDSVWT